jgi:hypothetical protein
MGHFGLRASLAPAELLGLCMGEEEERWGIAQKTCARCSEPGKPGIAKVVVEYKLE